MKRNTKIAVVGLLAIALLAAIFSGVVNVAQAQGGPNDRGGPGGGGPSGGNDTVVVEAAATALGMTADELRTALRTSTLGDIATSRNINPNTVEAAIVAAKKAQIDQLSTSLDLNGLFAALGGGGPRGGPGAPGGTPHPSKTPGAVRTPGPTRTPTP